MKHEDKTYNWLDKIILPIILIIIWYILADVLMILPSYTFPGPVEVFNSFINLLTSGRLVTDILDTLYKVILGLIIAAIVGISLGLMAGWSKYFERLTSVIVSVLRPIPPIAWIPSIFIIFMGCVFPIFVYTVDGVHRTKKVLIESALTFGVSNEQMITEVILPSTIPYIVSGLKVAIGIALMCTISGEMIGSSSGIGYMILTSTNLFDTGSTVVGMLLIGFIGIIFDYIFTKIQEKIFW